VLRSGLQPVLRLEVEWVRQSLLPWEIEWVLQSGLQPVLLWEI
jgi:hypothetical protein